MRSSAAWRSLWLAVVVCFAMLSASPAWCQAETASDPAGNAAAGGIIALMMGFLMMWLGFILLIGVVVAIGMWKVFEKAGKPGWAAFIPIYNWIMMMEITGKPTWWVALLFVPIVQFVVMFIVEGELAERFGQSSAYALGLFFLPFIFYPILGFGPAQFQGVRY